MTPMKVAALVDRKEAAERFEQPAATIMKRITFLLVR